MSSEIEHSNIELLSPVGSYESLHAAIKAGANAVYFGVEQLNMRSRSAKKFTLEDLKEIAETCNEGNVKSYLALNTLVYDHELPLMRDICDAAKTAGLSAVIATDISAVSYARSIGLNVHMSTQANISNIEAVEFYAKFADVVVLARELTLEQISNIVEEIKKRNIVGPSGELLKIELFVHGALCVSISGKCYMSLATTNHSANRGECLQNCRKQYRVIDESTKEELIVDNKFVMSPKDLCTIGFVDQLINAGALVFKIEGRGRSSDYVFHTTKAYREAIDAHFENSYTQEKVKDWTTRLENVFNRGFWHGGYYLGAKLGEWSGAYGSVAKKQKTYIGYVLKYFAKAGVAEFTIENAGVKVGETIAVTGPTTGYEEREINSLYVDDKPNDSAKKGETMTMLFDARVRRHDKVYVIHDRTAWQS
jgi:U32 family peptidase